MSNFFVALCASCMTLNLHSFLKISYHSLTPFAALSFLLVFSYYNFQRIYLWKRKLYSSENLYLVWLQNNFRTLMLFSFFLILILFYFSQELIFLNFYFLITTGIVSVMYFIPLFSIRKIYFLKPVFIAFFWTLITVIFPIYKLSEHIAFEDVLFALSQFCFVLVLAVLFDIRDVEHDRKSGTLTLPVKFSVKTIKEYSYLFVFLYAIFLPNSFEKNVITTAIMIFILTIVIARSDSKNKNSYFLFWVDGCMLFQFVIFSIF